MLEEDIVELEAGIVALEAGIVALEVDTVELEEDIVALEAGIVALEADKLQIVLGIEVEEMLLIEQVEVDMLTEMVDRLVAGYSPGV